MRAETFCDQSSTDVNSVRSRDAGLLNDLLRLSDLYGEYGVKQNEELKPGGSSARGVMPVSIRNPCLTMAFEGRALSQQPCSLLELETGEKVTIRMRSDIAVRGASI